MLEGGEIVDGEDRSKSSEVEMRQGVRKKKSGRSDDWGKGRRRICDVGKEGRLCKCRLLISRVYKARRKATLSDMIDETRSTT
jgi:hypothetical protein